MWASHQRGCEKSSGLFTLAATELASRGVPAENVIVVDDRQDNIGPAREAGFDLVLHPPLPDLSVTFTRRVRPSLW